MPPLPRELESVKSMRLVEVGDDTRDAQLGMDVDQEAMRKPLFEIKVTRCDDNIPEAEWHSEAEPSATSTIARENSGTAIAGMLQRSDEIEQHQQPEESSTETPQASVAMDIESGSPTVMLVASRPLEELGTPLQVPTTNAATLMDATPLTNLSSALTPPNIPEEKVHVEPNRPGVFYLPGQRPATPRRDNADAVEQMSGPAKGLAVRRSSFDLKNQWKAKAQNTSTDLLNDDMSFLAGVDESSYLDISREERYISRFGGHVVRGECAELEVSVAEITPDTSADSGT